MTNSTSSSSIDITLTQEFTVFSLSSNNVGTSSPPSIRTCDTGERLLAQTINQTLTKEVSVPESVGDCRADMTESQCANATNYILSKTAIVTESIESGSIYTQSEQSTDSCVDEKVLREAVTDSCARNNSLGTKNHALNAKKDEGLSLFASDLMPETSSSALNTSPSHRNTHSTTCSPQSRRNSKPIAVKPHGIDRFIDNFASTFKRNFNDTLSTNWFNKMMTPPQKTDDDIRRSRVKQEERVSDQIRNWEVLIPDLIEKRDTRDVIEMVYRGVPSSIRGKVWKVGVGNYLQITPELYKVFRNHSQTRVAALHAEKDSKNSYPNEAKISAEKFVKPVGRERTLTQIPLDLNRTFPVLDFFRTGGPYHESLRRLLETFVCYRPDVGYVQGMSFLACMLLLNMEEDDAFICFVNMMNRPLLSSFYQMEPAKSQPYIDAFAHTFKRQLPELYSHMHRLQISHHMFIHEWLLTCFSKSCPIDTAMRLWDGLIIYGDVFIIKSAIGILSLFRKQLLAADFDDVALFMTKLPQDMDPDELMRHIRRVDLTHGRLSSLLYTFHVPAK
eukprot:CFRG3958T1